MIKKIRKIKRILRLLFGSRLYDSVQDITFPQRLIKAKKILVILVPEHAAMSGGIYSLFSIADMAYRLRAYHDYEVVVMTRPNKHKLTYCREYNFRNAEDVYRFEQITLCKSVKELYINIPEYATEDFYEFLPTNVRSYIKSLDRVYINILNQNIKLMPEADNFSDLKLLTHELSQSVAHHAYFNLDMAKKYNLPTLLLPAYTDLSLYPKSSFKDKKDLIIYSLDDAEYKSQCLNKIKESLPNYELIEIRDMTFDEYMDLATRCRFSISFGEGFDGYVAQPIYQGGIGFSVYNDEFFPSKDYIKFDNFFESGYELVEKIVEKITILAENEEKYLSLNKQLKAEYDKLYQYDDYVLRVQKLIDRNFEIFP